MRLILTTALAALAAACASAPEPPPPAAVAETLDPRAAVLDAFYAAFNAHDAEAMAALCSPDVTWGFIDGIDAIAEATDGEQLATQMAAYFASTPGVRSDVEAIRPEADRVIVSERVYWRPDPDGPERTQAADAEYRFENGLIAEVWYLPPTP